MQEWPSSDRSVRTTIASRGSSGERRPRGRRRAGHPSFHHRRMASPSPTPRGDRRRGRPPRAPPPARARRPGPRVWRRWRSLVW